MSKEIVEAVRGLAAEKNISHEKLMEALEDALLSAYKKTPGSAPYAKVEMDRDSGDFIVWELKIPPELEEQLLIEATDDQQPTVDPETGEMREPPEPEIDLEKLKEYEDQIEIEDVTPHDFGRIAAQTAKQVILQRIREAERDMMFEEYRDRVGELITGIVQQSDSRYTLVQLRERVEALLPKSEQVDGERYDHSQRIKAVIKDVSNSTKGPSIIVSRRDPELIKSLFELEVPEIADGLVEITGVAREPGLPLEDRGRLARRRRRPGRRLRRPARLAGADGRLRAARREDRHHPLQRRAGPVRRQGAVAGARARGAGRRRRQAGDRDRARRPAVAGDRPRGPERAPRGAADRLADRHPLRDRVRRRGGRARLRRGGRQQGRCAAILSNGRRCPNAALPGSRYCGIEAHQALASKDTDQVEAPDEQPAPRRPTRLPPTRLRRLTPRPLPKPRQRPPTAPPNRPRRMHRQPRVRVPRRRRLRRAMNKRVHEIAKERGLPAKEVLARLKAAGIEVKAASSSVDEEVAARVLANGGATAPADGAKSKPPGSKAKRRRRQGQPQGARRHDARRGPAGERRRREHSCGAGSGPSAGRKPGHRRSDARSSRRRRT